jgi:hypothetical protein
MFPTASAHGAKSSAAWFSALTSSPTLFVGNAHSVPAGESAE